MSFTSVKEQTAALRAERELTKHLRKRIDVIKTNRNALFDENVKLKENNTYLAGLMQDIRNASDAQQQQSLIDLRAKLQKIKEYWEYYAAAEKDDVAPQELLALFLCLTEAFSEQDGEST